MCLLTSLSVSSFHTRLRKIYLEPSSRIFLSRLLLRRQIANLMSIDLREGFLFRATDPKDCVSPKPFVGSTVACRLRLHPKALNIDGGETMHSFRGGCSMTLSLLGASDDQVAGEAGWKSYGYGASSFSPCPRLC